MGEHEFSWTEFERASALKPNFTDRRLACALIFAGEFERAIKAAQAHMRADPFYFPIPSAFLGLAFYMLKQYDSALHPLRECVSQGGRRYRTRSGRGSAMARRFGGRIMRRGSRVV